MDKKLGNKDAFTSLDHAIFLKSSWTFAFLFSTGKRPDKHAEYFSSEAGKHFLSTDKFDQSAPWGGHTYTAQLGEAHGRSHLGITTPH